MYFTSIICISMRIRENWRKEVAHLPAPARYAGFTLIELSIVLVIIGLLVGGVLVGQDLIKAASERRLLAGMSQIDLAVFQFKLKVGGIPGDLAPAKADLFGLSKCTDTYDGVNREAGNGLIAHERSGVLTNTCLIGNGCRCERTAFANNLIELELAQNFKLVQSTDTSSALETNYQNFAYVPASWPRYGEAGNWLVIAGSKTGFMQGGNELSTPFSALTAKRIDEKLDDGKPLSGKVQMVGTGYAATGWKCSSSGNNLACVGAWNTTWPFDAACVTSKDTNAEYKSSDNLGYADGACKLAFKREW